ncbi:MAG: hypothetical protein AAF970_17715 [Bacteroidota bacterium]
MFRTQRGEAQWVCTTLGECSDRMVELTDGITAGDTVAVAGHFALAHQATVDVEVVENLV